MECENVKLLKGPTVMNSKELGWNRKDKNKRRCENEEDKKEGWFR